MATDPKRKRFLRLERERLTRYQHQHRGLNFLKLGLPPTTERNVNIIGLNNHIYKGKIPTVPLDQLPPEVDPKSIDEEQLYKEIRDMRFPVVPPLQSLGPARRIGGKYTTAKRMTFAPVQINLDDENEETPILGADGRVYQGRTKAVPTHEIDRKLRGTKRAVKTQGSSRGTVKPTVVSLYVDGKPPSEKTQYSQRDPTQLIELPYVDLNKLIKWMEIKSPEQEKESKSEDVEEQPSHPFEKEEEVTAENEEGATATESESTREFTSSASVEATDETSEATEETSTTSVTSSEVTEPVSEREEDTEAEEASDTEEEAFEPEEEVEEETAEPEEVEEEAI